MGIVKSSVLRCFNGKLEYNFLQFQTYILKISIYANYLDLCLRVISSQMMIMVSWVV